MSAKRVALRHRMKYRWWSWQNWRQGLRFNPIGRCRRCDHTSPYHYPTCRNHARWQEER